MAIYIVQKESLETVADSIRAKAGISEKLVFPDGFVEAVEGIEGGGPLQSKSVRPTHSEQIVGPDEDYYGLVAVTVEPVPKVPNVIVEVTTDNRRTNLIEEVVPAEVIASVFAKDAEQYYSYNGVSLPKIPEAFLAQYPYAVIIRPADSTDHTLYLSTGVFYEFVQYSKEKLTPSVSGGLIYKLKADNPGWLFAGEGQMPTTELRQGATTYTKLVWSNRNIPSGSATATEVYFAGSEPVPIE